MLYEWSSQQVPFPRLYDELVHVINREVFGCDCMIEDDSHISAGHSRLSKVTLGSVSVFRFDGYGSQRVRRTRSHFADDQNDNLLLYMPLSAEYEIDQFGHRFRLSPGQAAFVRLGRPLSSTFVGPGFRSGSAIHITFPAALLLQRIPRIDECLYLPISTQGGSGRVLSLLAESLLAEAAELGDGATPFLSNGLLEVAGSMAQELLMDEDHVNLAPRTQSRERIRRCVLEAIEANLTNPELSPRFLSRRCRMSLRGVHQTFEGTNWTVGSWIKEQRLLRCRQDLRSAEMEHSSVSEIAYRWGFKDLPHFNRTYKARFEITPGRDRRQAH